MLNSTLQITLLSLSIYFKKKIIWSWIGFVSNAMTSVSQIVSNQKYFLSRYH